MPSPLRLVRFQESGLLLVILALGLLLTVFSGSVRVPLFTIGPDGARQRVFTTNANGEREPATVRACPAPIARLSSRRARVTPATQPGLKPRPPGCARQPHR